ncbi:hypothetical protein TELCIR_15507 [Teladorsagia circumcincta]|uniref:Uncharacterized protein n=1 Tax=Teladorsagia circumcincta TaxID=45464 RepID=A0A2G9TY45_TELCI|nr:hypothetical protein TELCIR_15507 [Teladorsagia circumcincta]
MAGVSDDAACIQRRTQIELDRPNMGFRQFEIKPSSASPGKDILRVKPKKAALKKKKKVTKIVKEQLLTMNRKQRKAYPGEFKSQKNLNHDRAMKCKLLWEKIRSGKTLKQERDECVSKLSGLVKSSYAMFSTKEQRNMIISSFRGHAMSLIRIVYAAELDKPRTLDEMVAEEPTKKKLILQHLEEQLLTLVDK